MVELIPNTVAIVGLVAISSCWIGSVKDYKAWKASGKNSLTEFVAKDAIRQESIKFCIFVVACLAVNDVFFRRPHGLTTIMVLLTLNTVLNAIARRRQLHKALREI